MRIGVLGDIHASVEALTAVVSALRDDGADIFVQVGDIVGYGPQPSKCIEMVRDLGCVTCLGNHDAAVLDLLDPSYFNQFARAAIEWTRTQLGEDDLAFLRSLPLVVRQPPFTVVHGTLHMPEQFGYVISPVEAIESLQHQDTRLCFVGHSHVPAIYLAQKDALRDLKVMMNSEAEISYRGADRVLINAGSVGQPRDEDPRAAYAFIDTDEEIACIRRVEYDIASVQRKIFAAGLPEVLANRLALGV